MMKRPPKGSPRWMTTFTDLTMLLLTFFVLLVATSKQDTVKLSKMLEKFSDAEQVDAEVMENTIPDISHEKNSEKVSSKKRMDNLYKKLKGYVTENGIQEVQVYREDTGVSIVIVDNLIFDTGDANVKPEAKEIISRLAGFFQSVPNPIVVEGHTDSRPIRNAKFPSNWELSSARAANMIHHLIEVYEIDPNRLAAVGYADTKPVAPNDSPDNWAKNRRVVIYVKE
ncbi:MULTISPECIES: OmpA family protein [Bacillus cereus group]|uniref:OmpA/MotB domain protein n=1 Tax=Bacillus cytotoxicus (strain DSM 22905 / CIP 110041 / 391-98 / NVH 391-98) TaxID=315749 RepID=A7GNF4_BACCN|nr:MULTISPECIES: OmpA family protein [Bacillus cereus group]ABS21662.1 OmpA/MotB domain protein [Bacillus cytotoxicus NVH 391-98]AWC28281.1 flagellar motor protein MotS [Bacillus cytotoxicus]AWC40334.1 flagellar motor protein MotS [Bacillus cytotoxicus]AWC44361.1 flagellar motor protein MotS [Bacillus cytotoxicus]AWC48265.1 flagellar motor protein MotS [Bacillus cytotoxicus]